MREAQPLHMLQLQHKCIPLFLTWCWIFDRAGQRRRTSACTKASVHVHMLIDCICNVDAWWWCMMMMMHDDDAWWWWCMMMMMMMVAYVTLNDHVIVLVLIDVMFHSCLIVSYSWMMFRFSRDWCSVSVVLDTICVCLIYILHLSIWTCLEPSRIYIHLHRHIERSIII